MSCIAAQGEWGSVEWAVDASEDMPARIYYVNLPDSDKAKVNALFRLLANRGRIDNREKFRKLGHKAKGQGAELWEFKSFQHRFLEDFRPGHRFIIAYALRKKSDNLPKSDIEKSTRILREHDKRERGAHHGY